MINLDYKYMYNYSWKVNILFCSVGTFFNKSSAYLWEQMLPISIPIFFLYSYEEGLCKNLSKSCNITIRYVDDVLSIINHPSFPDWIPLIYPIGLEIKKTNRNSFLTSFHLVCSRSTRWVSLVELLTLPEHLSSHPVFSGVHVARSVVLCVCFVDRCLSFCTFSFGHWVVCFFSIYGFWLPLCYLRPLFVPILTPMVNSISDLMTTLLLPF